MLDEGQPPVSKLKRYGKGDSICKQTQQIWLALSGFAMMQKTLSLKGAKVEGKLPDRIYYSELASLIGRPGTHRFMSYQLGLIAVYCSQNDIPPLNVLVVNKQTNLPGVGVIPNIDQDMENLIAEVLSFDWYSVRVPTLKALEKLYYSDCEE